MAMKLEDIQKKIEKLKLEAATILAKGRREAISTINAIVQEFQLTAADLSFGIAAAGKTGRSAGVARKGATPKRAGAGVAKYRDSASGKTWTGFGKPPTWIKDAPDRSAFLISDAGQASAHEVVASGGPAAKVPVKRRVAFKSASKPAAKKVSRRKKPLVNAVVPAKTAVPEKVAARKARTAKKAPKADAVEASSEA